MSTSPSTSPGGFKAWLGRFTLKVLGWKSEGSPPEAPGYVIIAAPHTSNWDLIFLLAFAFRFGIKISWMGKQSLFRPPFGGFMRWLGGVPVDRSARHDMVQQMIAAFGLDPTLKLAVPPSGTRGFQPFWKTGFYHIARGAQVPVATGFLDYQRKAGGFGPPLIPSGDIEADMAILRAFYGPIQGKYPRNTNTIQIRPGDPAAAAPEGAKADQTQSAEREDQAPKA